jgi:hypothetical protein
VEVAESRWEEAPHPAVPSGTSLLILTSDLLVRDETLRWLTRLSPQDFKSIPNWPPSLTVEPVRQGTARVHGFNGTARLWRLPAAGLARGSVFRVEGEGLGALANMIASGQWLGERTHEGLGRFRLDASLPGTTSPGSTRATGGQEAPDAADETVARMTLEWLERHSRLQCFPEDAPSYSQWRDLVTEHESRGGAAIAERLNPTTAGKSNWEQEDASAILDMLNQQDQEGKKGCARMFVRWLKVRRPRACD